MEMHFYKLELYFQQKLIAMNDDIQFFQNYIKDLKSKNPDKAKAEIPDYHQIRNAVDQLEIDIKKVQAALLDNYKATTEDLLDRFKNLQKVSEVK
ncbi:MAG: hypothetical protein CL833_08960 [Crocinitomicaceae bacterium]|nr:hypothetical protein [Crocinitomicaceae bacterium]